ncbi:MAG: oxygen-dependent protoporphyrinogen oxidase [Puniceicoccaceae bacterium 5H]|nr:MAG: oxygen-dependent protoporphyrinogen oxidase [Puniceicoccaceae bacterium 5H]
MDSAPASPAVDVAIIGAGITGLALALELEHQGLSVCILERSPQIGGAIQTVQEDGYLCERGPNSLLLRRPDVAEWLRHRELDEGMVTANEAVKTRYLVKNGRVLPMPSGPLSAATTPLYSLGAKLGVLGEPFRPATHQEDESVADFVSRRLGPEFLDYGIAALVNGIYAGDAERLSIRHAFSRVWNLERKGGSLIKGALKLKRERKERGEAPYHSRIVSWADGLQALPQQIASRLQSRPQLSVQLKQIQPAADGWQLTYHDEAGGTQALQARQLVVTPPVHTWSRLPWTADLQPHVAQIEQPRYAPVVTMLLGFKREQVRHSLDGFGALIPPKENQRVLGAIFSSTLFPQRAPEGCVALSCFLGGMHYPQLIEAEDAELRRIALESLRPLLGITGEPEKVILTRWPRAIPQYELGYERFLQQVAQLEATQAGLHFLGNFREGPGLYDCLDLARRKAVELAKATSDTV